MQEETHNLLVLSYHSVRQALGYLGIALPLILLVMGWLVLWDLRPSISAYFNTVFRDIFVGIMSAIGVFLFSYKGYACNWDAGERLSDRWLARIAGVAAIGIALFPIMPSLDDIGIQPVETLSQELFSPATAQLLHYVFALTFFVCLILFALVQFPKTRDESRRRIYLWSGLTLVGVTAGLLVVFLIGRFGNESVTNSIERAEIVFWLEAIGIWAFGISWLTKGKADISLRSAARRMSRRM